MLLGFILLVAACASHRQSAGVEVPGHSFPQTTDLECPNESCRLGEWLACARVDVRANPGATQPLIGRFVRGDRFEITAGTLLTIQPGVVRVTREVRQPDREGGQVYRVGDTIYLLGHITEGFFAAIHNGRRVRTDIFWPWQYAGGYQIDGELIRDAISERWMRTSLAQRTGWVLDNADVVSPAPSMTCPDDRR